MRHNNIRNNKRRITLLKSQVIKGAYQGMHGFLQNTTNLSGFESSIFIKIAESQIQIHKKSWKYDYRADPHISYAQITAKEC